MKSFKIPRQRLYISIWELIISLFLLIFNFNKQLKYHNTFELNYFRKRLKGYLKADNLEFFSSSRIALLIFLKSLKLCKDDEIIIPAHTHFSIPLAVKLVGAVPVYTDLDMNLNMSFSDIKKNVNKNTLAVVVVYNEGRSCDIEKISKFCRNKSIYLVEDCAQAFSSEYMGQKLGTYGDIGLFSFSRGKCFDLFGGCCAVSRDKDVLESMYRDAFKYYNAGYKSNLISFFIMLKRIFLYVYLWAFSSTLLFNIFTYPFLLLFDGKKKSTAADIIGYLFKDNLDPKISFFKENIPFNTLQAILGIRKLKYIDNQIEHQRSNAFYFNEKLRKTPQIYLPQSESAAKDNYMYYPILVNDRDNIAKKLLKSGIDTKKDIYLNCSKIKLLRGRNDSHPVSEIMAKHILHIPVYAGLKRPELNYISRKINHFTNKQRISFGNLS